MKNLTEAAEAYVNKYNLDLEIQFDLIIVIFGYENTRIEYIESAFIPGVNW